MSDFGLAKWGSADSADLVESDVVGTFGYIAPEYFMYGRISDKIDVYAFGVVLLELLSGKRPIIAKVTKGQESLVKWVCTSTPLCALIYFTSQCFFPRKINFIGSPVCMYPGKNFIRERGL